MRERERERKSNLFLLGTFPLTDHTCTFLIQEAEALGHKDKLRMLKSRKLALIVDLDQTLIHTSVDPNIEPGLQVHDIYIYVCGILYCDGIILKLIP